MSSYFYHGIECYYGAVGYAAKLVIKILEEGILMRNVVHQFGDANLNHVCLYKKNDDYDYDSPDSLINSARGGWINHGFVFIINPQIEARKTTREESNLVDEWRCYNNISPDDIVGIALPNEAIKEYLNEDLEDEREDRELLKESLKRIMEITKQLNIPIYDSDKENFTDEIDSTLRHFKR